MFDPGILQQKLELALRDKNQLLTKVYNRRGIDARQVAAEYAEYAERLKPYVADTSLVLDKALADGQNVLLEGAQGSMLDVDHGTYPFVTSSNPTAGGAAVGSGIGPTRITKVIGIIKAYTTRVGSGPFPTELVDDQGEWLRSAGREFGVTTGRPRRTGWFDAVIARYATRINGVTDFCVTKLDILSGLDKVPVCVAYEVDGKRFDEIPMTQTDFHHAKPAYEYLDGWSEDISECDSFDDLPKAAKNYVKTIEELSGAPVSAIGVGPRRDQTLSLRPLLLSIARGGDPPYPPAARPIASDLIGRAHIGDSGAYRLLGRAWATLPRCEYLLSGVAAASMPSCVP
jgi:adenylosuccinate synthase